MNLSSYLHISKKKEKEMRRRALLFLVASLLLVVGVAACGTVVPSTTEEITIGQGDQIVFKAIGGQQGPVEVKIVFTTVEKDELYFQAFADGDMLDGGQLVYPDLDLFPGLTLQPETPPQITVEYDPKLWEVKP